MAGPQPLLIFPCNGNGLDALDCLGTTYRCAGFVDDTPEKQGREVYGQPVFGRAALGERADAAVLAVLGSPVTYRSRRDIIAGLGVDYDRFARVIHPTARVSPHAVVGRNVLVMAGVVITSNAVIGDHVVILPNAVLDHDVVVRDWAIVGANVTVGGGTTVGDNVYVGGGASLKDGLSIGSGALVGLGSTVIRDVPPGACVAGNPARVIAKKAPPA
jgi:sugar O-acyltransferase (sialic acid O-acetyltransferase NeuD family)